MHFMENESFYPSTLMNEPYYDSFEKYLNLRKIWTEMI